MPGSMTDGDPVGNFIFDEETRSPLDGSGRDPLPAMATAIVACEKQRRMTMDFKINRVALSTALVISGDKAFNDYFAVGAECTISRDHYNKLVFTLRRDPKAKRRPHAAKNDHYRWQIRRADQVGAGALRFGAVAPEAVYMNRDGEAIIILPLELPDVIETPNGVRRPRGSRRPKAIPMPHWDEVKLAVRMINNFISMAAGEFEVVVRPEGGIRLTRLDVAE